MIIEQVAKWTGYTVIFLGLLTIFSIIVYSFYIFCLKRWVGIDKKKTREYLYYFVEHEDKIKEYVDEHSNKNIGDENVEQD